MKRISLLGIVFIIILSGCNSKAYNEALQKGYDLLGKAKYTEAVEQFNNALEKKETEEAEKGKLVADAMFAGWDSYRAGIFNSAVEIAHNILTDDQENKAISLVTEDAEKLLEQAETMLELYNSIVEKIQSADQLRDDGKLEEALKLYEEIVQVDQEHFIIENLVEDTIEKIDEIKAEIKNNGSNKETAKEENNNGSHKETAKKENNNTDSDQNIDHNDKGNKKEEQSKQITPDEAEDIIRTALNIPDEVHVNYDHDEGNFYVIQVFEIVQSDGGGHTATWGWYKVNKSTGEWTEAF